MLSYANSIQRNNDKLTQIKGSIKYIQNGIDTETDKVKYAGEIKEWEGVIADFKAEIIEIEAHTELMQSM